MSPIRPIDVEAKVPNPTKQSVCREVVNSVFGIPKDALAFVNYILKAGDQQDDGTVPVELGDQFAADVCAITCTSPTTTNTTTTPGTTTTTTTTTSTTSTPTTTTQALISIVDHAPAIPYPSKRTVSGRTGTITKLVVNLTGLTHPAMGDIQMLLVAPNGTTFCKFMGSVGALHGCTNIDLVIDNDSLTPLPASSAITSGTYAPADYNAPVDLPAPAPSGPYSHDLTVFNGLNANGDWKLYIHDNQVGDVGSLHDWSLSITTA